MVYSDILHRRHISRRGAENVASNPDLVTSIVGSFSKDLEFPLALGDFAVDTFVVDACIKTKVEVLFNDGASDVTDR